MDRQDIMESFSLMIEKYLARSITRIAVLLILRKSSEYGYNIYKTIKEHLYSRLSLSTLYTILKDFEEKGLIRRVQDRYEITDVGMKVIDCLMKQYEQLLSFISIRLRINLNS